MTALTVAVATAATTTTAATTAARTDGGPRLRRLPVPVSEPRPALRVIRDDDSAPDLDQQCLALTTGSLTSDALTSDSSTSPTRAPRLRLLPPAPMDERLAEQSRRDLVRRQNPMPHPPRSAKRSPERVDQEAVDDFCAAVATSSTALPEPHRWAGQFVQAAVEVALGQRPVGQLVRWTSEEVHTHLSRRAQLGRSLANPRTGRPRVTSVHTCALSDGVVEASVIVNDTTRTRAVAVRLEGWDGRWRVTALQLG